MKIQLHLTAEGKAVFSTEKPPGRKRRPPHQGFRGWIERKAQNLKTAWSKADRGPVGKVHAFWDYLQSRMPADESMLAHLSTASTIEIYHPAALSDEEAQALWAVYRTRCLKRHLPWLGVNVLISPISLLLAPLPGPNLIGYWFAYRAVKDARALLGLRHARDPRITTTYHLIEVRMIARPGRELTGLTETDASAIAFLVAGNRP
ncbi:hypothetical protein V5E97_29855 [Singulisphaera sp. Ch08]|uniref:Uncharacterized protein n=1 Tax=Singulisphaera sp. Ch08 TaxID=3120278 RepID=A0AAU7CC26_9BACT